MRRTSWLSKVTSVYDIDPSLYIPKSHHYDEAREDRATAKQLAKLSEPLPVNPEFQRYFGSRMHDSWIIGISRTATELRIKLDSINADILVLNLIELLAINRVPTQWPIDLILHHPIYVGACRHDLNGTIRHMDFDSIHSNEPQTGDTFLGDHYFRQDGGIQMIAEFWCPRPKQHKLSTSVYMMADGSHLSAMDHCPRILERVYGPGAAQLYRDAMGFEGPDVTYRGVWGMKLMADYLANRIAARNLNLTDFNALRST